MDAREFCAAHRLSELAFAPGDALDTYHLGAGALTVPRYLAAVRPGNRLGDVSAAIGEVARSEGYRVNLQFGGHGVGRTMHGDPHVPNDGVAGKGLRLRAGLVIAIEPWFMAGGDGYLIDDDGWTIRSADGSRAAHAEHTVAITARGPVVLTAPPAD